MDVGATDRTGASSGASEGGFLEWKDRFTDRARRAGIGEAAFDRAFLDVRPSEEVVRLDSRQPEFTLFPGEYLDALVTPERAERGRKLGRKLRPVLAAIERRFGVEADVLLSIWGIESSFGAETGSFNVVAALATLAWRGRRRQFAEEQLLKALEIIEQGELPPSCMRGSWAGAMGQVQFIPSSFLEYAVDFDCDGRRDIWNPESPADALASAANYLLGHGWQRGRPWGVEVLLPDAFDYLNADLQVRKPAGAWLGLGVAPATVRELPDHCDTSVFLPAGCRGPAFLVTCNFRAILAYNRALNYALAVGHLADRISGRGGIRAAWPRNARALAGTEVSELQQRLIEQGFDAGAVDGLEGPDTRAAVRAYQAFLGLTPDGFASPALLERLR